GEKNEIARGRPDCGNIAGREICILPQAGDYSRAIPRGPNISWTPERTNHQSINAAQPLNSLANRVFQRATLHVLLDEVCHDFRVGLGDELVSFFFQFLLKFQIILNDAVVYDYHLALTVPVRMGVFLGRPAMRSPARMTQAIDAVDRMIAYGVFKIG